MPNGAVETMKDQEQDAPPGQPPLPDQGGNGGGSVRERVVALETQREHLATRADLTEQVSRMREDTNRQFNELREDMNRQFTELRKEQAELREEVRDMIIALREESAKLRSEMSARLDAQMRCMVILWLSTVSAFAGLQFYLYPVPGV